MSDYIPKSIGETYLRHKIARHTKYAIKMANAGKEINHSIITVPIEQAVYIVNKHKENTSSTRSAVALLEELERLLDAGYESYSPTKMRSLCRHALLHVKKIK